ncbi:hypothetical protein [Streptomyces sp. HNM0574]|uniref:hypothetical protein n=1 Tax=Streptomyces sp. HNM0574 TaxID=2714954 RepID=UPI00146C2E4D|nr:hypothetical protein [Streptomyces sp. HNM0574]NLU66667.1 hypothetical protein [Streptomyces sp. HNM0574]
MRGRSGGTRGPGEPEGLPDGEDAAGAGAVPPDARSYSRAQMIAAISAVGTLLAGVGAVLATVIPKDSGGSDGTAGPAPTVTVTETAPAAPGGTEDEGGPESPSGPSAGAGGTALTKDVEIQGQQAVKVTDASFEVHKSYALEGDIAYDPVSDELASPSTEVVFARVGPGEKPGAGLCRESAKYTETIPLAETEPEGKGYCVKSPDSADFLGYFRIEQAEPDGGMDDSVALKLTIWSHTKK